jgi:hypothetical protein
MGYSAWGGFVKLADEIVYRWREYCSANHHARGTFWGRFLARRDSPDGNP